MDSLSDVLIKKLSMMGISYEIIEHEEILCVDDGIKLLKFPEENILKTIGFEVNNKYIFAVLQGKKRLDYKKLVQSLQIKRKSLKMIPTSVLEKELGYQVGGLSPIHIDERINVFVDTEILSLDKVFCGIGVRNKTLKISSEDLILVSKATVLNLVI